MKSLTRKITLLSAVILIVGGIAVGQWVKSQLSDIQSSLYQLHRIFFPPKYVNEQMVNFRQDLKKAESYAVHDDLGWGYAKVGNYEKAIEEYKKSIEIIQKDPGYQDRFNGTKEELATVNEEVRVAKQAFPRNRLLELCEKTGRHQEALEQIDWLLVHKPLDHVRAELLTKKQEILQKIAQTQSNP